MRKLTRLLDKMEPPAEGDWTLEDADDIGADCD